ncbi:hypothetical protein Apa02nite_057480 [Actinoplanes palleronii]|uniref:DUF1990 domain-containing protein n=2 Tax=Actinoplanes palleronii TaxID=113570 RepID=A0ABQ4BH69_9ACTN|nr:hypothetical protein Apa02nite_057480 [Actinoplanes palleronii]
MTGKLSYGAVGLTHPGEETWSERPKGYRRYATTAVIGHGQRCWDEAASAVLDWQIKTRSGFAVESLTNGIRVRENADYRVTARIGPFIVHEPVRVVAVVDEPMRCGFAYGTLFGHPVSGEEAFVVHRDSSGEVRLTLRSLTRSSQGRWRWAFPALLVAQKCYRYRYRRALRTKH